MSGGRSSSDGCGWPSVALACSSSMVWKSASSVDIAGLLIRKGGRPMGDPRPSWARILLRGLLGCVAEHRFGLEELVEGVVAPLAPIAAHLVAAEGGGHVA